MPSIMIVAGEPSGDLHASRVAAQLKLFCPDANLFGMGGDLMEAAGVSLVFHIGDTAVMGIAEVVSSIPGYLKKYMHFQWLMRNKKPDAVLLVDFADFNMAIAESAYKLQIPVIYYIPPKAWAWRSGRGKKIAKRTSVVASIFPFEAEFYRRSGARTEFVGHPLRDFAQIDLTVQQARAQIGVDRDAPVLGLLPGSRCGEVKMLLPVMLNVAQQVRQKLPKCQLILPLSPSIPAEFLPEMPLVKIVSGATYAAMRAADLTLVASGTATLEAACIGVPMIVLYKMSWLSWWIVKRLVKLDYSALPNIIAGRQVVPEFLQSDVRIAQITRIACDLLQDSEKRECQRIELKKVCEQLGDPGAVERTARLVLSHVE